MHPLGDHTPSRRYRRNEHGEPAGHVRDALALGGRQHEPCADGEEHDAQEGQAHDHEDYGRPADQRAEDQAIDHAAEDLEAMGYRTRCIALAARDLGADHIRQRYWLLAYTDDDSELLLPVDAEVAELPRVRAGIWAAEPDEPRMVDGVAHRVDRLAATGNGQVPVVAAAAWQMLTRQNTHNV